MGATKKRRQTKHRGNAAGMVEARGRTRAGAPSGAATPGKGGPRIPPAPSWQKAFIKALIPLVLLLVALPLLSKGRDFASLIPLGVLAYVMYVPISYYTDKWAYDKWRKRNGLR